MLDSDFLESFMFIQCKVIKKNYKSSFFLNFNLSLP